MSHVIELNSIMGVACRWAKPYYV